MKFKKIEKNILIGSLSVVGLGAVVGASLAVANSLNQKEITLENDNIQGENNKVFLGTTLTSEDVKLLGWDKKTSISLSDWAKQAPEVTQIGNGDHLLAPFYANNRLQSIEIPARITNINKAAFYSTSSLTNITFEDNSSISSIGELAFNNSAIKGITIPESVKSIGEAAFANTPNLQPEKIIISSDLKQDSDKPLYGFSQDQWDVAAPAPKMFQGSILNAKAVQDLGWNSKATITLADWDMAPRVIQISPDTTAGGGSNAAFINNKRIRSITIPKRIQRINYASFHSSSLRDITFEKGSVLTRIGEQAFSQTPLGAIHIPSNTTQIGRAAFENTSQLSGTNIKMPARLKDNSTAPLYGFNATQWGQIYFYPDAFTGSILTKQAVNALGWNTKSTITLEDWADFAPNVTQIGDPNVNNGNGENQPFQLNKAIRSIAIPDRITAINFASFYQSSIQTLTFTPTSKLNIIKHYAFRQAKIRNITIPAGVTSIGDNAFWQADNLGQVNFATNAKITSIGIEAFADSAISGINVPDSVTTIGNDAFRNTGASLLGQNVSMSRDLMKGSSSPLYGFNATQWGRIVWRKAIFRGNILTKQDVENLGWDKVTNITLNDWTTWAPNVTELGNPSITTGDGRQGPFSFNNTLQSIQIPAKVTRINFASFHQTPALRTVSFENGSRLNTIGGYVFRISGITTINIPNGVTSIGEAAFKETQLTSITLPNSLTSLGNEVFSAARRLTSINIPAGVTTLGRQSFRDTVALRTITFAANSKLTTIGVEAFWLSGITKIVVPKSVTSLQNFAFIKTGSLTDLTFEAGSKLTTIGERVFQETRARELDIPNSVTNMNARAFGNSGFVTNILLSSSLRNGSLSPLYGLNQTQWERITWKVQPFTGTILRKVDVINLNWWGKPTITLDDWKLAANVTQLGASPTSGNVSESPFANNTTFRDITLPSKITHINLSAFAGTTNLSKLTFQDGSKLQVVGNNAFDGSGITAITLADSVTDIATTAFLNTSRTLPGASISISSRMRKGSLNPLYGFTATQWNAINWRIAVFEGPVLQKVDVIDLGWDKKERITLQDWAKWAPKATKISREATSGPGGTQAFAGNKILKSIEIPARITEINYASFYETTALQTITFEPKSKLTTFGVGSFEFSGLRAINIPASVVSIQERAFNGTNSLATVTFEEGSVLNNIDQQAFNETRALQEIILPNKLKVIGTAAFWNAKKLAKVFIPNSVTTIGQFAFNGADALQGQNVSILITLRTGDNTNYGFTQAQWNTIAWRTIPFDGTVLRKADVEKLGWNLKTEITLKDWETDAPKVTTISESATAGDSPTAAFIDNIKLKSIAIPSRISRINFGSFKGTTALQTVTFEANSTLSIIESAAFRESSINSIRIPASVTEIVNHVFQDTPSLKTITFENNSKLAKIGLAAFERSGITAITVPDSVVEIAEGAFNGTNGTLPGQSVSMDIKLKKNSSNPLYGFTQAQWNTIRWRGTVTLSDTITRSFLVDFKEGSNIVNMPALNWKASSSMTAEARDAGLGLQYAIGTSESDLIIPWNTADQIKLAITNYASDKDILKSQMNIFARMYLPTGTGENGDMIGDVRYIWTKTSTKIYDNSTGTIANLFVAPGTTTPVLTAGKFIRAYAHIPNDWADSLSAGGNKSSAVRVTSAGDKFDIAQYTAKGVKLEVSPDAGKTWTTITTLGTDVFNAAATGKMQFRLSVLNANLYEIVGNTVVPSTTPTGTMTNVVEKAVIAKLELKGINANDLVSNKLVVSGSTQNLSIVENPELYTVSGLSITEAKKIFQIKYSYNGTTFAIASAFGAELKAMRGEQLNALNLANFKVKYEFTEEGLSKYYSTQVANDPEAEANVVKTLDTTNVLKTIDLTSQINDAARIKIAGSTESFTWTNNESILALTPLVNVEYGTYTRAEDGTLTYGWSQTMPTSIYSNTIPVGQTNYPLAIRFMPKNETDKVEIGSISRAGVFSASNTTMGYGVDVSKLVAVIKVDTSQLVEKLILTGFVNNLNNGQSPQQIEQEALNLIDPTFRNQVQLQYEISNLPGEWLSLVMLQRHMTSYAADYSNETSGIMIFNNPQIAGVTIKAKFVAKDPEKYVVQSTPNEIVTLNTSQIKTNVDLRGYVNVLKTQKVIPSGTSADNLGTLTLPTMTGGNVPFSQKSFDQISAILATSIDIQFKAPGFNGDQWVALNQITAVNVNNELYIRFVVKAAATTNIELSLVGTNDWAEHQNNGFKLTLNLPIEIQVDSADLTRLIKLSGNTKQLVIDDTEVYTELNKNPLYEGKVQILYTIGKVPIALDTANPNKTEFTKTEITNLLRNYTTDITLDEKQITAKYALAEGVSPDDYIIKDSNKATLNVTEVLLFINKSDYYAIASTLKVSGTSSALIWGPEINQLLNGLSKGLTLQYTTDPTATATDPSSDAKWTTTQPTTIDPITKFLAVRLVTVAGYVFEEAPRLFKVDTTNVLLVVPLKANDLQLIELSGNTKDIVLNLDKFNAALESQSIPGREFIVVQYYFGGTVPASLDIPVGTEWFSEAQIKLILQTLKGAKNTEELILLRDSIKVRYSLTDEGFKTHRMNIDGTFINTQAPEQPAFWKPLVTQTLNAGFNGYINLDLINKFTADNFLIFGSDKKPELKASDAISKMLDFYKDPAITPFDILYSKSKTDFSNTAYKLFGATGFIDRFDPTFTIDLNSSGQAIPIYFKIVARTGYQIWENNIQLPDGKVIEITNFDIQPQITNPLTNAPEIRFVSSTGETFYQGQGSFSVYVAGSNTLVDGTFLNKEYPSVTPPVLKLEYNVSDNLYTAEELEAIKIDPTKWSDQVPTNLKVGQYVMTRVAVNNPIFTMTGGDAMTNQIRVSGLKVHADQLQLSPDLTLTNTEIYGFAPLDGQSKIETATIIADELGNYLGADLQMSVDSEFYTDASGKIILDANNIPIIKRNPEGATQNGTYKDSNGRDILDGAGNAIPIWTIDKNGSIIPAPPLSTGNWRPAQKMIDWSVAGSFSQDDTGILDWRLFEGQVVRFSFVPRVGQGTNVKPDFIFDDTAAPTPEITLSNIKFIIPTQGITYRFDQAQLKEITYASDDDQDIAYTGAAHISSPLKITKILANFDEEVIIGKEIEEQVAIDYEGRVQIKMQLNKRNGTTQTAFGSDISQFKALSNGDVITINFESKDPNFSLPRPVSPLTIVVKNLFIRPLDVDLFKNLRPDFTGSLNGSGAFSIKVTNPNNPTETNETILGVDQWYEYQVWNPDKSLKTAWTRDETKINNLVNGDKIEWKLVNRDGVFENDYYNTLLAQDSTPENIQFRVVNVEDKIEHTVQSGIGNSQEINPDNLDGSPNYPEKSGWVVADLKIEITLDSIQQEKFEQALSQFQPTFSGVDKFGSMSSNITNDGSISKDVVIVWYVAGADGMPRRITDFKDAGLSNGDQVWASIAPSAEAIENNLIIDESISQMQSKVFTVEGLTTIVNSTTQTLIISLITASSVILVGIIGSVVFMRKNGKLGGNKKFKL